MRPPISSAKNDGIHSASLLRKTHFNQKEILAENQNNKNRPSKNPPVPTTYCELSRNVSTATPTVRINQQPATNVQNLLLSKNIVDDSTNLFSLDAQLKKEHHQLIYPFNEKPSTSSTTSIPSSDTKKFNLNSTVPYQLSSKSVVTQHFSNSARQQPNQLQQLQQQQCYRQSTKDSSNPHNLKCIASDVSDNRLKNNHSNRITDSENTFTINELVKTNSNLDSLQITDDCSSFDINNENAVISENGLLNYVPNLNTQQKTSLIIVPSSINATNCSHLKNKITESIPGNKSKSIILNFEYPDDTEIDFYYQKEKNNSLSENNVLINRLLETEPLLKSIENIDVISEANRNNCFNKNCASLILIKNKELNNDKFDNSKINNSNNNNNNNSHKLKKNNCIIEGGSNYINNQNNYNNIKLYNNYCESISSKQDNSMKNKKRKSYPNNYIQNTDITDSTDLFDKRQPKNLSTTATTNRKQLAYSWYAPVYSALEEEIEQESRDRTPIHNLANIKKKTTLSQAKIKYDDQEQSIINNDIETQSLLENNKNHINIQTQSHYQIPNQKIKYHSNSIAENNRSERTFPSKLNLNGSINNIQHNNIITIQQNDTNRPQNSTNQHQSSLLISASQIPRRKRFENFIKTLVGRKTSKETTPNNTMPSQNDNYQHQPIQENCISTSPYPSPPISYASQQLPSPEITITYSSSQDFSKLSFTGNETIKTNNVNFDPGNISTAVSTTHICDNTKGTQSSSTLSLNTVQQKLWNFVPLLRREGSAVSLYNEKSQSIVQYTGLRKCETVLALSSKSSATTYNQIPSNYVADNNNGRQSVPGIVYNRCVSYNPSGMNVKYAINRESNNTNCSNSNIEPIRPLNRLRNSSSTINANCSRCSSLLSVTASGSRYSLNIISNNNNSSITMPSSSNNNNNNNNNLNKNSNLSSNDNNNKSNVNSSNNNYGNLNASCSTASSLYESLLLNSRKNSVSSTGLKRNESITSAESSCVDSVDGDGITDGIASSPQSSKTDISTTATLNSTNTQQKKLFEIPFVCKLCLNDVNNSSDATIITQCCCSFCTECMKTYVHFEISEGAYEISCPDAQCPSQGIMNSTEIAVLASAHALENYHRYKLNREIELDKTRTWCPRAGCETICMIKPQPTSSSTSSSSSISSPTPILNTSKAISDSAAIKETTPLTPVVSSTTISVAYSSGSTSSSSGLIDNKINSIASATVLCAVQCPTCREEFCSGCKKQWHPSSTCEENNRRLNETGQDETIGIPFDNDLIKSCPMCAVPIEKDEGCAQMMCKRCKHVFCWYCLASLDDDFLLRHYDKGPCKNKLGHSRASVVWHRAQVIGIFAGFGILLLVASPLLLLAAPCIICCKCRICSGGNTKLDDPDADFDEAIVLQR